MRPVVTQHGFPVPSHDHTQHHTERILADRARELGARFLWSSAVVGVQQNAAGVEVIIDGPEVDSIRAGYLVGCDGGHSRVRELSGIAFPGDAPLSHWVVGDIALDSPPDENGAFGRNEVIGTYQISRAEPGWFRLSMMRTTPPADRTAPVTLDEIRDVLRTGLGTDYGLREARWASRFSDGFRQATTYRQGRVLLAGDAAHTHSPIGGQGLNLGIQDAVNLGWKLAATVAGTAPAGLLDTYHAERHPVVHAVLRMTKAQTALIKPGHQVDALRDLVGDFLADPGICLGISGTLSGLDLRYPLGDAHPLLGRRIPNLQLTTTAGPTDSHTLLHPGRSLLIDLGAGLPAEVFHPWAGTLDVITAKLRGRDENHWHIPVLGDIPAPGAVFVRPDGYIAWLNPAGEPLDPAGLTTVLAGWLGH